MPFDPCDPCGCVPANIGDQLFYQMATNLLCSINENISSVTGGGVSRYDIEFLCDPGTGDPVIFRYHYQTDGTVVALEAFNLDGTAYGGVIADLVACGGGGSGGDVNIAEVGGVAVTLASFGIFAEDTAHVSGNSGVFSLGVRNSAGATLTDTDGDYSAFAVNLKGSNYVDVDFTHQAVQATGLLKVEDTAHVSGDAGVFFLGVRNTAGGTLTSNDGDYSPVAVDAAGSLYVDIDFNHQVSTALGILKLEDAVVGSGDAGIGGLFKRQDNPVSQTSNDGDYSLASVTADGRQYVDGVLRSTPTSANPSIANATSVTLLAANAARRYLLIQNNSGANVMISLTGAVLTGIVPSTANPGIVLLPNAIYESPPNHVSVSAITVYQTSGGAIETISVVEA